ncbi:unnamed protein product [Protopolystoma xenopodis]|uniref:18 kDa Sin3-associated polypeptide n=1 Tax=Protopolystoma xenopodis TaxID=117903 RepID=A0A448XC58_9PLAT|nr:unnamed protein product [Protopolystoma xenopodis]
MDTARGNYSSLGAMTVTGIRHCGWLDATLYELAQELREHCPLARRRGARLVFTSVSPDERSTMGAYKRRQLGLVITGSGPVVIKSNGETDGTANERPLDEPFGSINGSALATTAGEHEVATKLSKLEEKALPADAGLRDWKPPLDDAGVTLLGKGFQIGDYIDVAISEPIPNNFGGLASVEARGPSRRLAVNALATLSAGSNFGVGNRMEARLGNVAVGASNPINSAQFGGPVANRVRGVY